MTPLVLAALAMLETSDPPTLPRAFRGVWIATVVNIDWPSKQGLPASQAQAELEGLIARLAELGCNAVVFQVRPMGDAFYRSELEPWSSYLTGTQGRDPGFDPLQIAVAAAHRHGMELHAWVNPFRARHATFKGQAHASHLTRTQPGTVVEYGNQAWVDPNAPGAQEHALRVVEDIVRRYDIDGLHIDDYFYPYPVRGKNGKWTPFPDGASWARRPAGATDRGAWRRAASDRFVESLYTTVKRAKPWVKVGVSPFGIARPGVPAGVTAGVDQFADLNADPVLWLRRGWLDYLAPQLYWRRDAKGQPYEVLLDWWLGLERPADRRVWPGLFTSQVGPKGANWPAQEVVAQVRLAEERAGGAVHFSARALTGDWDGVGRALAQGPYREPALVPPLRTTGDAPAPPEVEVSAGEGSGWRVRLKPGDSSVVRFWVVSPVGGAPGRSIVTSRDEVALPAGWERATVSALDRAGRLGRGRVVVRPAVGR